MTTSIQQRFLSASMKNPGDELELMRGSLEDFNVLMEHHYRADKPATALRVLALRCSTQSAAERYSNQPVSSHTVAVLVESLPSLSCKMRDWALNHRYGTWLPIRQRAAFLNREVRVISRIVVHPCWRGLGLAVRLVRAALQDPTTLYTESLAAMGRVNPFFERAGMTAYRRPPHAVDSRLLDAMNVIHLEPSDMTMLDRTLTKVNALTAYQRDWFFKELNRWYRQNGGRGATHSTDPMTHMIAARNRLMLDPVYYLHDNSARFHSVP